MSSARDMRVYIEDILESITKIKERQKYLILGRNGIINTMSKRKLKYFMLLGQMQ